ncbi:G5 domain-containing protein [Nocardioides terrae]|uniref:G5 domain-containing protein n=1 Tax=Nocardioides terrae TaxID=574651 RepID=UPI003CCB8DDB
MVATTACDGAAPSSTTESGDHSTPAAASSTGARSSSPHASATSSPSAPVITNRIVRSRNAIPFSTRTIKSSSLDKGTMRVQQSGRPGVRVKVYRLSLRDGVVRGRQLVRTVVARAPVPRIKVVGTHVDPPKPAAPPEQEARCDSNYSSGCVPIASDVDCGGGSGNGPAYVYGVVRVVGVDIYDLDRDSDGYGCDD